MRKHLVWNVIRIVNKNVPGIVLGAYVVGSELWGVNREDSDIDVRVIFQPVSPQKEIEASGMDMGYSGPYSDIEDLKNYDIHVFSVFKYFRLLPSLSMDTLEVFTFFPHNVITNSAVFYDFLERSRNLLMRNMAFVPLSAHQIWGYMLSNLLRIKKRNPSLYVKVKEILWNSQLVAIVDQKQVENSPPQLDSKKSLFSLYKGALLWSSIINQSVPDRFVIKQIYRSIGEGDIPFQDFLVKSVKEIELEVKSTNKAALKRSLKEAIAPLILNLIITY